MTTKVIVLCPDSSVHDALVYVETRNDDSWVRNSEPIRVEPRAQSEPIYLTATTRLVIEEAARGQAEQQPA